MITEDYVSFNTAKLLKEKGFNEYCRTIYNAGVFCSIASLNCRWNEGCGELIEEKQNSDFGIYDNAISAPTLQMVMKWLREVHKIYISVSHRLSHNADNDICFSFWINEGKITDGEWLSYEEACESGIRYCLENLI